MENSVEAAFLERHYVSIYQTRNERREVREESQKANEGERKSNATWGLTCRILFLTSKQLPPNAHEKQPSIVPHTVIQVQLDELLGTLSLIWLAFHES